MDKQPPLPDTPPAETAYMRYIGAGEFVQGVPARDLTRVEWDALDTDTQALVLALGLYELAGDPA